DSDQRSGQHLSQHASMVEARRAAVNVPNPRRHRTDTPGRICYSPRSMAREPRLLGDSADSPRQARRVILVVDDDAGLRESFRLILEDEYEVLDAADGPRALELVRTKAVDLVLLDIRLPDMDGIEVLER